MESPSYYAVIPASVRYDERLKANEKLLYGELTALSQKDGFAFASNGYFAKLYGVAKTTVSEWLKDLQDAGYIKICIDRQEGNLRRILVFENPRFSEEVLGKSRIGIEKKAKTPLREKPKQNNTSNNTKKEYIAQSALGPNTPQDFHFSREMENAINQWLVYKAERRQTYKGKGLQMLLAQIKKKIAQYNEQTVINLTEESMANNWQGIAWGKLEKAKPQMLRPEDIEL